MKVSGLIDGLSDALDLNKKKRKKAALHRILKKMKKKEVSMKKALASAAGGKEKKRLQSAIKVTKAHRRKGIKEQQKLKGKG